MMKLTTLVATVLAICAAREVHADPRHAGYLTLGGEAGAGLGAMTSALAAGGGYHLGTQPLYFHAQLAVGGFDNLSEAVGPMDASAGFYRGSGSYAQVRAGIEYLECNARGWLCGVYGADLGALRTGATTGPWDDTPSARYTQGQAIPRIGIDIGDRHLRLRTSAELAVGLTERELMSGGATDSRVGVQGLTIGVAVAYRL